MTETLKLLLASALLCALTLIGAAPTAAQQYNWTGLYFGGNIGGGWGTTDYIRDFPGFAGFNNRFSHDHQTYIYGGLMGVQQQYGRFVVGGELGLSGGAFNSRVQGEGGGAYVQDADLRYLYTAAVKAGYVFAPRWLGYVKAGYAGGQVDIRTVAFAGGVEVNSTIPQSMWENGWTAGIGFDYRLTDSVIVGFGYDYISLDIGNRNIAFRNPPTDVGLISGGSTELHTFTSHVSILLGPAAAGPPGPMK